MFRAAQAYIGILRAQEVLRTVTDYRQTLEGYQDRIHLMVEEGAADESETAQARNMLLLLEDTKVEYEGQRQAAFVNYMEVVGSMPSGDLERPRFAEPLLPALEDAVLYARQNHPLILAARKDMEAAGYDTEAETATLWPDLDGELSYLKRDQKEEIGGEATDARALLKMSWAFSTGGAERSRIRRSRSQQSEALAQSREQIRQVEQEVRLAYAELDTSRQQLELAQERQEVTQELFDAYEVQFEGARIRLLQLMQSDNQLFSARLNTINADYRYLLAQYAVLGSLARLEESVSTDVAAVETESQAFSAEEVIAAEPEPEPDTTEDILDAEELVEPDLVK